MDKDSHLKKELDRLLDSYLETRGFTDVGHGLNKAVDHISASREPIQLTSVNLEKEDLSILVGNPWEG